LIFVNFLKHNPQRGYGTSPQTTPSICPTAAPPVRWSYKCPEKFAFIPIQIVRVFETRRYCSSQLLTR